MRRAFWQQLSKTKALIILVPLLIIIIVEIATTSFIPYARKLVMDALVNFDKIAFTFAVGLAFSNSLFLTAAQGLKEWTSNKLAFLFRESLMTIIKVPWMDDKDGLSSVTNPCARLNEDARVSTEQALKVFLEVIISIAIVLGLIISIMKWPILLGAAVIYSVVSMGIAIMFRNPMINSKYALLNAEGEHRIALTKISIQQNDHTSKQRWTILTEAYKRYINTARNYKLFNAVQEAAMYSLPFILMAPAYFSGHATIGDVTQGTLTFDLVVLNSTILVKLYPQIIEAQTSFIRIKEMYNDVTK